MKRLLLTAACASAIAMAPVLTVGDEALAGNNFVKGLIGGVIAGAIISSVVQAGQYHCHAGLGCHTHGYAGPNHYHQIIGGPIVYYQQQPVVVAPSGYPQAHYVWCGNKFASYDAGSNTYQPYGPYPRRECISPYIQ